MRMSHLTLSLTNSLGQTESTLCLQHLVAVFPKDLVFFCLEYLCSMCEKHALLLYMFFGERSVLQTYCIDLKLSPKNSSGVTVINPISTLCYCHQNVIFQTILSSMYTNLLKSVLQDSIGLVTTLLYLNHWTVINKVYFYCEVWLGTSSKTRNKITENFHPIPAFVTHATFS